jgi:microcin C transport system substrate-binding protein
MRARSLGHALSACLLALWPLAAVAQGQPTTGPTYAFATHGDVKYPANFTHFDYVNPDAPKGGEVILDSTGAVEAGGTFDSFNPFILSGVPAAPAGMTFDTLMAQSLDEPATSYCLVCQTVEVAPDRSWVEFALRPEARFQDGSPITADDLVWTFETLITKGAPLFRQYYAPVLRAEKTGERQVRFFFKPGDNRELPGILGQLPLLSKKYWSTHDFTKTTLEPPLGSGPYKIESFEQGRYITLRRVPDYWGANLPVNKGMNNFDVMRTDYYRDDTVALEAFLAGKFDIQIESSAKTWATGYDTPAVKSGLIQRATIPDDQRRLMQGFFMNTRRPLFLDRRVREALVYPFDFEWMNKNFFYNSYARIRSYFGEDDELSAHGLPQGPELALLEPFRSQLPPEVFTKEYAPPKTDGSGNWRDNQRMAFRLLQEAGWHVDNGRLVDASGKQMQFEILLDNPSYERIALPYVQNLKQLGIDARVRTIDASQYERRLDDFDFDMVNKLILQSASPGNEQRDFFGSASAGVHGSQNIAGIKDPIVDALVDKVVSAPDRATLAAATRALDRVLLWGFYVVPQYNAYNDRVAYWDRFGRPKDNAHVGANPSFWWVDPQKDAALKAKRGGG